MPHWGRKLPHAPGTWPHLGAFLTPGRASPQQRSSGARDRLPFPACRRPRAWPLILHDAITGHLLQLPREWSLHVPRHSSRAAGHAEVAATATATATTRLPSGRRTRGSTPHSSARIRVLPGPTRLWKLLASHWLLLGHVLTPQPIPAAMGMYCRNWLRPGSHVPGGAVNYPQPRGPRVREKSQEQVVGGTWHMKSQVNQSR